MRPACIERARGPLLEFPGLRSTFARGFISVARSGLQNQKVVSVRSTWCDRNKAPGERTPESGDHSGRQNPRASAQHEAAPEIRLTSLPAVSILSKVSRFPPVLTAAWYVLASPVRSASLFPEGGLSADRRSSSPSPTRGACIHETWTFSPVRGVPAGRRVCRGAGRLDPGRHAVYSGAAHQGKPDLALEYLQRISKNASPELLKELPLELAKAKLDAAGEEPDSGKRLSLYSDARDELQKWLAANPTSPRTGEVKLDIAQVAVMQGRTQLSRASSTPISPWSRRRTP